MRRFELQELEDQAWYPQLWRDYSTDFLRWVFESFGIYDASLPLLEKHLREGEPHFVVDLCSGGAGPWPRLLGALDRRGLRPRVTLTDLYPRVAFDHDQLHYHPEPCAVDQVPAEWPGLRTVFTGFHHLGPEEGRRFLETMAQQRQRLVVLECVERSCLALFTLPVLATLACVMVTPFIRPFRWSRLLFTYGIPVVPLTVFWDGSASMLKAYTVEELRQLAPVRPGYRWEAGQLSTGFPFPLTYLVGYPGPGGA